MMIGNWNVHSNDKYMLRTARHNVDAQPPEPDDPVAFFGRPDADRWSSLRWTVALPTCQRRIHRLACLARTFSIGPVAFTRQKCRQRAWCRGRTVRSGSGHRASAQTLFRSRGQCVEPTADDRRSGVAPCRVPIALAEPLDVLPRTAMQASPASARPSLCFPLLKSQVCQILDSSFANDPNQNSLAATVSGLRIVKGARPHSG